MLKVELSRRCPCSSNLYLNQIAFASMHDQESNQGIQEA